MKKLNKLSHSAASIIKVSNKYEAIVDIELFEYLNQFNWYYVKGYAGRNIKHNGVQRQMRMHREILGLSVGDGKEVDHINGDKLDNRRCNLRIVSHTENMWNIPRFKKSKTGYKGVSKRPDNGKYRARITINRQIINLGQADTPEEAFELYKEASKRLRGKFGRLE